jgi:hypothetical protein
VIILGLILLVIGFVIGVPALWSIGLILVVIGAISPASSAEPLTPTRSSSTDGRRGDRYVSPEAASRVLLGQAGCVAG